MSTDDKADLILTPLLLSRRLVHAIDLAKGNESRARFVEECLRQNQEIRFAAETAGIVFQERRSPGRPVVD